MTENAQHGTTMFDRFCYAMRALCRRYRICRRYAARLDAKVAECFTWYWIDL